MATTLYLLDGMALAYRAHFALIRNPIINSKGVNTSALFGFTNTVLELIQQQQPSHLAIVFDTSAPTERHRIHPEYKANRDAMPEELVAAMPQLDRIASGFNIPVLRLDGYEADDIIGTLAHKAADEGFDQIFMVTPDKDFGQLVTDKIKMYRPSRQGSGAEIWGIEAIKEKWSIRRVDQVIDMLGLCGDTADNIPGIPGIGPKTAAKLLASYDSVEGIIEHVDALKGKQRERVQNYSEQALLSKRLAKIQLDVPIGYQWEDFRLNQPDLEQLGPLLNEFEFRSIGKRLFGDAFSLAQSGHTERSEVNTSDVQLGETAPKTEPEQLELIPPATFQTYASTDTHYQEIESLESLESLCHKLTSIGCFAFDTETTHLNPRRAKLIGISLSHAAHRGFWIRLDQHPELLQPLASLFSDPSVTKLGHNLKYDLAILLNHGLEVQGPCYDTMLAHAVLEPEQKHTLDALAESLLHYSPIRFSELFPQVTTESDLDYSEVHPDELMHYAVEDADLTWQLWQQFKPQLDSSGQAAVFYKIETPLVPVLMQMEQHGICLDEAALSDSRLRLSQKIDSLQAAVFEQAQQSFNLNSPKQLGHILFDELKLVEKPKKTKTGQYQTNEQVLTQLASKHPIVAEILEYRQLSKLKSTYVDALPKAVDPITNRIHTHYAQLQTSTGRLASNQPNLQNIPIRTSEGQAIRKAFIPQAGWALLAADYSQIELRILAALSKDTGLLHAFQNNEDIHASTAAKIFEVPIQDVTRDQRSTAKMVNFGIPYGISAFGLSQRLGTIGRQEAQEIIDQYFAQFPGIPAYMQGVIEQARSRGYVETLSGRRRFLRDIGSRNATIRAAAERNAINMPIQGTAADMIKQAMTRIHTSLRTEQLASRLLLQVHDELVLEVAPDEMPEIRQLVRTAMLEALPLDCPLEVSLGQGENWLAAH